MVKHSNGKLSQPFNKTITMDRFDYHDREGTPHEGGREKTIAAPSPTAPSPRVQIPDSLVVTAAAYRKFMSKNRLDEVVEGLLEGVNIHCTEELQRAAAQIKGIIHMAPIPEPVYSRIYSSCQRLGEGTAIVWPVTMPYEQFRSSREFQECPYLEASGPGEMIGAIKTWWASLFDATAIYFREMNRQSHRDAEITVAAQQAPVPRSRLLL